MILARMTFADGGFHKTRKRRQDVDRRIDSLVVQLAIDKDLSLCDVTSQVRNWMSDVCSING